MLMTDLAVRDLEGRRDSMLGGLRRVLVAVFGRTSDHHLPAAVAERRPPVLRSVPRPAHQPRQAQLALQATGTDGANETDLRWQRHPQLRSRQTARPSFDGSVRSARLEAERGMILARGGKINEAIVAFTTAAGDPNVDLAALPGFWDLPRSGMSAAVRAYERTDRLRDAAALEARMRHTLKPRAVRSESGRSARFTASGD